MKNVNVTKNLTAALNECKDITAIPDGAGILLYHMASKIKAQILHQLPLLVKYILDKKLDTTLRVDAALDYLMKNGIHGKEINATEFETYCGVGIVITPEEIDRAVEDAITRNKAALGEQRYRFNVFKIVQEVREQLPWADGKQVKNEVDVQIFDLLGEKTAVDLAPPPKKQKEKKPAAETNAKDLSNDTDDKATDGASSIAELMKTKVHFHAPGENFKTDGYVVTPNTERLLKEHLKITSGRVRTRFPPEPNGILHIGHAKAININFGYAKAHNGTCNLRYDDTNPEKEEEKFFVGIKDMVEWLGYKPDRITYSSDNFQQLYEWAVVLIRKGLAYVCHQTADEMKGYFHFFHLSIILFIYFSLFFHVLYYLNKVSIQNHRNGETDHSKKVYNYLKT